MDTQRKDIMVDLETLAIDADCVILSVGACEFDITTGEIKNTFYSVPNIQNQIDNGRVISQSTLIFWINQAIEDPKSADIFNSRSVVPLEFVIDSLNRFIPNDAHVWSNGASFDCAILERIQNVHWVYNKTRDTRTYMDAANMLNIDFEFKGTKHNALADSIHQAKYISAAYKKLNL